MTDVQSGEVVAVLFDNLVRGHAEGAAERSARTARARGLPELRVVLGHRLPDALLPVLTVPGLDLGSYLTGSKS